MIFVLIMCGCLCLRVGMCSVSAGGREVQTQTLQCCISLGAGVTDRCEPPDVGHDNRTWFLWKSSNFS